MIPRRARLRGNEGFTLGEVIVSCLLGSLLLLVLFAGLLSLQRTLLSRPLRFGNENLPVAPAYSVFPAALRLEERLTAHLSKARATYVLGGSYPGLAEVSDTLRTRPLCTNDLPDLEGCPGGLPRDSAAFYQRYANLLGETEATAGAGDFTVLVIGPHDGSLQLTCVVQVRGAEVRREGDVSSWLRLSVTLRDIEGGRYSYAYVDRPASASQPLAGASHLWHRLNEAEGVVEEGPACVVLPDPWRFPGREGFSRFTHFLPLSL